MYFRIKTLLFVLSFLRVFAQGNLITTYSTNQGLPEQTVYDCVQDNEGNMWFAAEGGLMKYDGTDWGYIDTLTSTSNKAEFYFLRKDENGSLWIFPQPFKNRIFLYNGSTFSERQLIDIGKLPQNLKAISLSINKNDTSLALITTHHKVFAYNYGKSYCIDSFSNPNITPFDVDLYKSSLFVSTSNGIYEIDIDGTDNEIHPLLKYNIGSTFITDIIKDSKNRTAFVSLTENSLLTIEDNKINLILTGLDTFISKNSLNFFFIEEINPYLFYFGSKFEAFKYESLTSNLSLVNEKNGYFTNGATSSYVDSERNTWITSLRGINKIRYSPFSNYFSSDGLLQNEVTSIEKFPNGNLVLAHNNGITLKGKDYFRKIDLFDNNSEGASTRILNMLYDKFRDLVWFVSQSHGVGYVTRAGNVSWVFPNSDNDRLFLSLYLDDNENLFFSDQSGIFLLQNNNAVSLNVPSSLNIRKISSYDSSRLILASKKGLMLIDKFSHETISFVTNNGNQDNIYSFLKLDDKNWLVGTYGGLLVFDGKTLKPYENLSIDKPVFFIGNENEFLWFGLMGGALRWDPTNGEKKLFTLSEGLAGEETNRDAFLFDGEKVYIGTNRGLSVFLPEIYNNETYKIKPKIYIKDIIDENNFHYNLTDKIALPFNRNSLTLEYRCPSFVDEKENKFYIHIKNLDTEKTEIIETSSTNYILRKIDPGDYILGINAVNANNISSDTLYSAGLTVKPPFYMEVWFIITLIVISLTITYSFYDFINRNKYARQLELEVEKRTEQLHKSEQSIRVLTQKLITAQEKERERIARELHDNIAQDLAIIKSEIEYRFRDVNTQTLVQKNWLSEKVNDLTKYVRDMAFFLHPNSIKQTGILNAIQTLCSEFESLSNIKVDFYSNLSEPIRLSDESLTNIYRFIQESLTNIRKHSKANNAIVILVEKDETLSIRIEDDGVGFDTAANGIYNNGKKMGLKGMEERIKIMNGKIVIKSVMGEGTKINAQVPFEDKNQPASDINSDHLSGS